MIRIRRCTRVRRPTATPKWGRIVGEMEVCRPHRLQHLPKIRYRTRKIYMKQPLARLRIRITFMKGRIRFWI
jgi:hypothetical protein